ncbi:hypothetical protein LO762_25610 [Actinocorallia sp. API 0066]|uniref:hypothetical protein n=1 Tax=Actinocorallia sp. API 0066 TaxID=2896846 RepID=UPI001E557238|nr:hypothetical protein [Actinocorallia sp. API 0066]MCD0452536.1 hypothetical protein [Actinocorallia sp. API 0066]
MTADIERHSESDGRGLGPRVVRLARQAGIHNVGQLVAAVIAGRLDVVRGIGPRAILAVRAALADHGLDPLHTRDCPIDCLGDVLGGRTVTVLRAYGLPTLGHVTDLAGTPHPDGDRLLAVPQIAAATSARIRNVLRDWGLLPPEPTPIDPPGAWAPSVMERLGQLERQVAALLAGKEGGA